MNKLCVNFGNSDWHVGMSVEEFEAAKDSGKEFIILPLLFNNVHHSVLRVRPSQIRYYFEEVID